MTTFQSPLKSFKAVKEGVGADLGDVVLSQSVKLQAATAATVEDSFYLPPGAQIISFLVDNQVLWTATTAGLTIGSASAGTQYVASLDVKANGGRTVSAITLAQAATMEGLLTSTSVNRVYVTVASTGANAVGTTRVTVLYRAP
jgi:hypothetical protein